MMFIRHLAMLGALAAIAMGQSPAANDSVSTGTLYDEGCFCFHQEDLDAFLSFAADADNCSYTESIQGSYTSLSVSANFLADNNVTISRYFSVDDYGAVAEGIGDDAIGAVPGTGDESGGTQGYCSSNVYYSDDGTGPSDLDGRGEGSESNYASLTGLYAGAISECQALIEAVKGEMTALGCDSYVYPCPYACVNGDCSADGCSCWEGWTGDSCEECDQNACVNGVCREYGCECNLHWAYPTCTECDYGWTGDNCDVCDPTLCGNGNCSDYGCECNLHWAYPTCTECESGWTGDNCDECDPSACVNGNCTDTGCACVNHWMGPTCTECEYGWMGENCDECDPSVCVNGNCTDTGCVCDDKWIGPNCDTCIVGWMGANCDTCEVGWTGTNCDACDAGVCADGYCSSCMNGQCTDSGCVCDPEWYGDKCDRVYDEGCPCFNVDDVEYFLNFAEIAGPYGNCDYSEDWPNYLSLSAYFNAASYSIGAAGTACFSFRTYGMYVTIDAEESSVCRDIIMSAEARDQMAAAGCYINEYNID